MENCKCLCVPLAIGLMFSIAHAQPQSGPPPLTLKNPVADYVSCVFLLPRSNETSPFALGTMAIRTSDLVCPTGVKGVHVDRLVYDPAPLLSPLDVPGNPNDYSPVNLAGWQVSIVHGTFEVISHEISIVIEQRLIAVLTTGSPDVRLSPAFKLEKGNGALAIQRICTSGMSNFNVRCAGRLHLMGVPVR